MEVTDFDYDLPQELIAQTPVEPRDSSRLLVMDKKTGELEHRHFFNLPEYLKPGDLLVFNDTRVIPARLHGFKTTGAHVEVFLLTRKNATDWEVLVKPGKKLQKGARIKFSDELSCEILDTTDFGGRIARFQYDGIFEEILDRLGETPLPPYIHETGGQGTVPDRVQPGTGQRGGPYGRPPLYQGTAPENPGHGGGRSVRHSPCGAGHLPSGE